MERLKVVFGIHNHQPIGNFDHVMKQAVETCYMRQLDIYAEYLDFRLTVHTSGPLLEWMDGRYPDYDKKIRAMAERGQIEPMGGGFYEPILPAIPREDALMQIRLMKAELARRYDAPADGLWLAERVWQPSLPALLAEAGVRYTAVDDTHFRYAGLTQPIMTGYYLTESEGSTVAVFPISKELRYYIPFREPEFIIEFLKRLNDQHPGCIVTYADDGEKFGIWPGTYDWVYNKGWLRRFIEAMLKESDWLDVIPFSEAFASPPAGSVYLPTASYDEMMEWSLPSEAVLRYLEVKNEVEKEGRSEQYRPFLRGGLWNNFFVKYRESNLMNKMSLFVSKRVREEFPDPTDPLEMNEARRDVLRSQCNCAYWHGLFGGIYFNNLRDAVWERIIKAHRKVVDPKHVCIIPIDIDCDGFEEAIVEDGSACWGLHSKGGSIFVMESLSRGHAFHNTMRRREEAYHHIPQGPAGTSEDHPKTDGPATIHDINYGDLGETPVYDRAPRRSFQDYFFGPEEDVNRFVQSLWKEEGDFQNRHFTLKRIEENIVELKREGIVGGVPTHIVKTFTFEGDGVLNAEIFIESERPLYPLRYGVGFNFTLLAPDAPDRYYQFPAGAVSDMKMNSSGVARNISKFGVRDDWRKTGLAWELDPVADIWRAPVYTLSRSEQKFEKTYQSSWVMLAWPIPAGEKTFEAKIALKIVE